MNLLLSGTKLDIGQQRYFVFLRDTGSVCLDQAAINHNKQFSTRKIFFCNALLFDLSRGDKQK